MDVAGEHDGVLDFFVGEMAEEAAAFEFVAGPLVHGVGDGGAGGFVDAGDHDLLGEDVPRGGGAFEAGEEPVALAVAHHGALGVEEDGARGLEAVALRLGGAVLAGVEDVELREAAVGEGAIQEHVGAVGLGAAAERHVLEVGLVGGGAALEIGGVRLAFAAGVITGVVVADLMVVPGDDPRGDGVGALEGGVGFVEGVAGAVIVELDDLGAVVAAHAVGGGRAFINVVAEMDDEIEVLAGEVVVGGEEAGFVVLAGGEGEAEARGEGVGRGRGAGAAGGADLGADFEAIPIPTLGAEAADLDVDGVRPRRIGDGGAGLDEAGHGFIVGDLPGDFDGLGQHAAGGFEGLGGEAGPEDHAVGERIAGRDAQGKRIRREFGRGGDGAAGVGGEERGSGEGGGAREEGATGESACVGEGEEEGRHGRRFGETGRGASGNAGKVHL